MAPLTTSQLGLGLGVTAIAEKKASAFHFLAQLWRWIRDAASAIGNIFIHAWTWIEYVASAVSYVPIRVWQWVKYVALAIGHTCACFWQWTKHATLAIFYTPVRIWQGIVEGTSRLWGFITSVLRANAYSITLAFTIGALITLLSLTVRIGVLLSEKRQQLQAEREEVKKREEQQKKYEEEQQRKYEEELQRRILEAKRRMKARQREQEEERKREEAKRQWQERERKRREAAFPNWKKRRPTAEEKHHTTVFPEPPMWPCSETSCERDSVAWCEHSMEQLYRASGGDYGRILKDERKYWHPDRFEPFDSQARAEVKIKTTRMFQIIGELLKKQEASIP